MTVDELIERSHAMAMEKGWWPEGEQRSIADQVNDFHAAISDVWLEYRAGRIDLWWRHPDEGWDCQEAAEQASALAAIRDGIGYYYEWPHDRGAAVECMAEPYGSWACLADLLIRLSDTMGAYGWKSGKRTTIDDWVRSDPPFLVRHLHGLIDRLADVRGTKWSDNSEHFARRAIRFAIRAAWKNSVDLLDLCELKMQYNATRSHRHGGKKA